MTAYTDLETIVMQSQEAIMAKVFIGAGHGGKDVGATGNGLTEKDLTLSIALYCKAELTRHGAGVKLSRERDEDDPLREVIRECNAYAPDVAVDIHINAGGGDGFEVFHTRYGGVGKTLAKNIEEEVIKIGQNSRGLKIRVNDEGRDYFGFIRETRCPAVILEAGFLDSEDRKVFDEPEEQRRFGMAYAKGILRTLGIAWRPDNDSTVQAAVDIIRKKAALEQQTIDYLLAYRYAKDLVIKLAAAME